jgi:hypothetical protein
MRPTGWIHVQNYYQLDSYIPNTHQHYQHMSFAISYVNVSQIMGMNTREPREYSLAVCKSLNKVPRRIICRCIFPSGVEVGEVVSISHFGTIAAVHSDLAFCHLHFTIAHEGSATEITRAMSLC